MSNQNLPSIPQHVKDTVVRYFKDVAKKLPVLKTIQPLDPDETQGITCYNHFQVEATEETAEQMWQRDVVCIADVLYFKEDKPLLSISVYRRVSECNGQYFGSISEQYRGDGSNIAWLECLATKVVKNELPKKDS